MSYSNLSRHNFQESIRCVADTTLYELSVKLIEDVERNKKHPFDDCHWKNSAVYSEFWRRRKDHIYREVFDLIQVKLGYKK